MSNDFYCATDNPQDYLECFMEDVKRRNPREYEFHQAVEEVAHSLLPFIFDHKKYLEARILERLSEPDRVISFRVCWEDDEKNVRVDRGFRVQYNNSIGPYKGGLRFDPSVNQSILKFLGFEQTFKNSLTTLPLGGAKGGANFNPKGKSDREIMRFCQSYMNELWRHIGPEVDVPAGDIGVGSREIAYMFGQYKKLAHEFSGAMTGKGIALGGSLLRTEATGYGLVYFAENVLHHHSESLENKVCSISGSGNVATYAAEKLIEKKAKVVTLSDSKGSLYFKDGITLESLSKIQDLKNQRRCLSELDDAHSEYKKGKKPWTIPVDLAFPCATQNEIEIKDAQALVTNACRGIFEGANMPCTTEAVRLFNESKLYFGPGKAANAGGVSVSGLEMSQNALGIHWKKEEVDQKLKNIMQDIHDTCVEYGKTKDRICYMTGANIGGFVKVADAMLAYGIN